nr:aldehyde ferredoxin oxidoreductase C-terminal domain-containing protein [Pyrobaculum aerophilum]
MTRVLNLKMGAGPDGLPERFFKPVRFEEREYVLTRGELEAALRSYYALRAGTKRGGRGRRL